MGLKLAGLLGPLAALAVLVGAVVEQILASFAGEHDLPRGLLRASAGGGRPGFIGVLGVLGFFIGLGHDGRRWRILARPGLVLLGGRLGELGLLLWLAWVSVFLVHDCRDPIKLVNGVESVSVDVVSIFLKLFVQLSELVLDGFGLALELVFPEL